MEETVILVLQTYYFVQHAQTQQRALLVQSVTIYN
jgi:hypothetical protein